MVAIKDIIVVISVNSSGAMEVPFDVTIVSETLLALVVVSVICSGNTIGGRFVFAGDGAEGADVAPLVDGVEPDVAVVEVSDNVVVDVEDEDEVEVVDDVPILEGLTLDVDKVVAVDVPVIGEAGFATGRP